MENTSYALYIVASFLVGIIILSLLVFGWRRIGTLENAQDETVAVKNKAEFNAEYLAYEKSLMYGTDVLSCLNKAQNNNQKYVYNNYYGTETETLGKETREEFFIDVAVTLKSGPLCDDVKAYYKDKTGKYQRVIGLGSSKDVKDNYNDNVFQENAKNHFDIPTIYYYYFRSGKVYQDSQKYSDIMWKDKGRNKTLYTILNTGKIETTFKSGIEYHLLTNEDTSSVSSIDETAKLAALITTVSLKNQTIVNSTQPTTFTKDDWWYCTWTSAASDFKSRKFKCTGVGYNQDNGYINKLSFEEIN